MSQPNLIIPAGAVTRLCTHIRRYGQVDVETGGLLLTGPEDPTVQVVALAGTTGIVRKYGLFIITRPAFDAIFTWAEDRNLRVRAMVHSHAEKAFLSRTDREGGLRVPGFYSAVVPTFASPPADLASWGWWIYRSDWVTSPTSHLHPTADLTASVVFDGDGVRAN
jgi:hypothetical protein